MPGVLIEQRAHIAGGHRRRLPGQPRKLNRRAVAILRIGGARPAERVDRRRVVSGMGERPAIEHFRDFNLGGMTTGSGCIAPRRCCALMKACDAADWKAAEAIRAQFMPLEDLRDAWGPARVLHHATELSGLAPAGPIPPFVSALDRAQLDELAPVARRLKDLNA